MPNYLLLLDQFSRVANGYKYSPEVIEFVCKQLQSTPVMLCFADNAEHSRELPFVVGVIKDPTMSGGSLYVHVVPLETPNGKVFKLLLKSKSVYLYPYGDGVVKKGMVIEYWLKGVFFRCRELDHA